MGQLIAGEWKTSEELANIKDGNYVRPESQFRHWVSHEGNTDFLAEPNRYHLYISYACPWACRALIFYRLKKLDEIISVSTVAPLLAEQGWAFDPRQGETRDPLFNKNYLHELYTLAQADYTGRVTVPILWDKYNQTIVNNESAEIIRMFNTEFNTYTEDTPDFCPPKLEHDIDALNIFIYDNINNGVYKCGFAKTQEAYDENFDQLFSALDELEKRLSQQRYLLGNDITESDWRLFTSLIRFDAVYVGHFKCNLRPLEGYPQLSNYVRDLYQIPGIAETVRMDHIKTHYYMSHPTINPTRIIPKGPELDFTRPHDRGRFSS